MAGRKRTFEATLTEEEKSRLESIASSRTEELRHIQRAKIILMSTTGQSNTAIAEAVGVSRPVVNKIVKRFASAGIDAALEDAARSGRPQVIDVEQRAWIKSLACQKPTEVVDGPALALWSIDALATYVKNHCKEKNFPSLATISASSVWAILREGGIKPNKIRYYLEKKDPEFEEKAKEVLLLYKRIEWITQWMTKYGKNQEEITEEIYISYDEKPGIQAIANKHDDRQPNANHGFVRRDYEYVRHGTVSLLAGIDLVTGHVHGIVREQHKSAEFIEFLKLVDGAYPQSRVIRVILDNHAIHHSEETLQYLATKPNRFKFTFTPKHASWLNLIEAFFGKMARTCLRGLRVTSKNALVRHIETWLNQVNETPVPFRWKWNLEDIEAAFK